MCVYIGVNVEIVKQYQILTNIKSNITESQQYSLK
jgi:hypothetical protein